MNTELDRTFGVAPPLTDLAPQTTAEHTKEQVNAMIASSLQEAVTQLAIHASGVVPDPAPMPPAGSAAAITIFSWIKWLCLLGCGAAVVLAGGMIALGNASRRAEMAERGKLTLFCAIGGTVVIAVASTLITSAYNLG